MINLLELYKKQKIKLISPKNRFSINKMNKDIELLNNSKINSLITYKANSFHSSIDNLNQTDIILKKKITNIKI